MNIKKNSYKTVSVLLLAALLCALPCTLAWAEGTDISAIQSDTPSGIQTGEMDSGNSTGTDTTGSESGGAGSGTSTGTDAAPGSESGGSITETGSATGEDVTGTGSGSSSEAGSTTGGDATGTGSGSSSEAGSTTSGDTTGTASGSFTEATPTPDPTPTTTPTPSPAPTSTPTPSRPVVLKDPTDETVDVGGDCWFIADYSNALYAVWHFVSPDGKTDYSYDDPAVATAFPGLRIENGDLSNLHLLNIPAEMNGWRACCEYRNNTGSTRTNYAVVHVNGAAAVNPSPSPSPTPTATPTPTPTPSPSATAIPSPSPETSPNVQVSPTPETTDHPTAPQKRGGKIFLLFGAVTVLVGAVAIGTILLVSRRMSEKEEYTYKDSSRRRK